MTLRVPGEIELEYRKAETGKSKTGQAMPPSSLQTYTVPHLGLCQVTPYIPLFLQVNKWTGIPVKNAEGWIFFVVFF